MSTWILGVFVVGQVYVSWFVATQETQTRRQKWLQIGLIWLLPGIAAIVLWAFHRSQMLESQRSQSTFGAGRRDSIDTSPGAGD